MDPAAEAPVVLIDAYSQIFRSYYAVRRLTDGEGNPVNALYVFTRLLLGLERERPTRRGALLFDCGRVAFRLKLLPEYKANRPPMPEDLRCQLPRIREMAAAFGWPLLQSEGYEADDLIGAFARAAAPAEVRIVSADKDLSQLLVEERVKLLSPEKGNTGALVERGAAAVREKFGVAPERIPDYLALVGDSSDNIAGIAGIGPKSAAELLNTFGAIENWIDAPERLAGSRFAAKLAGQEELLRRNLGLVRLRTELPAEFADPAAVLAKSAPDWGAIAELCRRCAFRSILKELPAEAATAPAASESPVPTAAEEGDLFAACAPAAPAPEPAPAEKPADSAPEMVQGELF